MKRVILAGIPPEVGGWLEERLPGVKCVAAATIEQLRTALPADLVLLDHSLGPVQTGVPTFYSVDHIAQAVSGFQRILVHPLDPDELLKNVANTLEISLGGGATMAIRKLWTRHRPEAIQRARAILEVTDESRREAERAAHRLAGSAGTFGYPKVSELAKEAETLLQGTARLDQDRLHYLGRTILQELGEEVEATAPPVEHHAHPYVGQVLSEPTVAVWEERLSILHKAAAAVVQKTLTGVDAENAIQEARRLRVACGLFGLHRAAEMAGEIQALIAKRDGAKLADRVLALRKELARDQPPPPPRDLAGKTVLLAAEDSTRFEDLRLSMRLHGLRPVFLPLDVEELPEADAALIEHTPASRTDFFKLLGRLADHRVATVVLADQADLGERVRATRMGMNAFMEPGTPLEDVFAQLLNVLRAHGETGHPILCVDDDESLLEVLSALLTSSGYRVVTESDSLKAWERLHEVEPELVILDVDMPSLNGIELCRVFRQEPRWATLPIIFLTANREPETIARLFAAGADDFVMKPLAGPELLTRVKARLDRLRRTWSAVQTGQSGGRRLARERLGWLLQLAYRLQQPVCVGLVKSDDHQRFKGIVEVGDVLARWNRGTLVIAMMAVSRQEGLARLSTVVGDAKAALACFPADGGSLEELMPTLEEALAQGHAGRVASPSSSTFTHDAVVVDDDAMIGGLVVATLESEGFIVTWRKDSAEALEGLLNGHLKPRVLLLDVDMPGLDGFAVLAKLSEAGLAREMRVIMLTGISGSEQRVFQAVEGGAFDYVAKPFDPSLLVARVKRARESLS